MRRTAFGGYYIRGRAKKMYDPANKSRKKRRWPPVVPLSFTQKMGTATSRALGFSSRTGSLASPMLKGFTSEKVKPSGAGSTTSYYKSIQKHHPGLRVVRKIAAPQRYHFNAGLRVEETYGRQAVNHVEQGLNIDLYNMVVTIPGYNANTNAFLDNIHTEYTFTNQCESTTYVDLYEVTPRYLTPSNKTPRWAFQKGLQDAGIGATGCNTLGAMPTMSPAFTTMFKIHKRFRLELAQGQSHRHVSKYNIGYRWNEQLVDAFSDQSYNPRTTRFLMIIASGAPLNDKFVKTNVSTGLVALDIVTKSRYTWYYNDPSSTNYKFATNLPAISAGSILDIGSGEPEDDDVA